MPLAGVKQSQLPSAPSSINHPVPTAKHPTGIQELLDLLSAEGIRLMVA